MLIRIWNIEIRRMYESVININGVLMSISKLGMVRNLHPSADPEVFEA